MAPPTAGWREAMTEATAYTPCSRKGEVRAQIATELMDADKAGRIVATIGRSADFYGPEALLSIFGERFSASAFRVSTIAFE